jgi:protein O-GlcNAc transferase
MNNIEIARVAFFKGLDCLEKQDFANAENCFLDTLKLAPRSIPALNNLAIAQYEQKKIGEAALTAQKVIEIDPRNIDAYIMLSTCHQEQKKYEEALATCDTVIGIDSSIAQAHCNRGYVLNKIKKYQEAIECFDRAIAIQPDFPDAFLNRGNSLLNLKVYVESLQAYDKAIALKPDLERAWLGRGNVFYGLKRFDEALVAFDKALTFKPDFTKALVGRGNVFYCLKRYGDAFGAFDKAILLNPELIELEGFRLHTKLHLCDWSNFDAECAHLISSVRDGKVNAQPFTFLAFTTSPEDQLQCAKLWVAETCPPSQKTIRQGQRYRHDRIRVAYVSSDFREHAVSRLIAGMFECHDKSRFEITAISIGPDDNSEMRQRLKASFERFIDATTYSDGQVANLIRSSEVDMLVDLMGFTADSRTGIFARRAAPTQVNYLGYPGTMGANYIDYIISDQTVIPDEHRKFYAEKIAVLPNTYLANDRKRAISDKAFTRSDVGLPLQGFVFCCFNNSYKITPRVFDCWMRILRQIEGSVLWLSEPNASAASNLKKEAVTRGINSARLVFAKPMPLLADHLARLKLADLFLDTLPYNAHTTASDALWAGLPVLTQIGETFAGRVAASLLNAIHLPELITTTLEAYEHMAVDLATHPEKLTAIKHKLAENRLTTPLFDTKLFTKHIEAAYTMMYERNQAGLAPDYINIPD